MTGRARSTLARFRPAACALLTLCVLPGADQVCGRPLFPHPTADVTAWGTVGLISTDIDDDGDEDLIAAVVMAQSIAVMRGDGDGSFAPAAMHFVEDAFFPTVADLDSDGSKDLVVATFNGITVLMGHGDGTFATGASYPESALVRHVAVGDFNEDDSPDIVYVGQDGLGCFVRLGNGDGTFGPAIEVGVGVTTGFSVAVSDFDADGLDDIAYSPGSGVEILIGNGDGTFAAAISLTVGDGPFWIAAGDLSGDGIVDLAVTNFESDDLSLLAGNGDGTFAAEERLSVAPEGLDVNPFFVAIVDLDGDGLQDLAVSNYTGAPYLSLLFGVGGGQFGPPIDGDDSFRNQAYSMAIGDFDGDGNKDVARPFYNGTYVHWMFGDGSGGFVGGRRATEDATSVTTGDIDGDGRLDLAVESSEGVTVMLATGAGTFGPEISFCADAALPPCPADPWVSSPVVVGELTGDAHADLAVGTSESVFVLAGDGTGSFSLASNLLLGTVVRSLGIADLNGDESTDILVATGSWPSYWLTAYLGNGDGTFHRAPFVPPAVGMNPESMAIAHLNGDEHLDVVVPARSHEDDTVLLGVGDGSFVAAPPITGLEDSRDVAVGDVNGDQLLDLVIASTAPGLGHGNEPPPTGLLNVLLGNGDGTFSQGAPVATPDLAFSVVMADFDGDGRQDLAAGSHPAWVFLGHGDGTFAPGQAHASYSRIVGGDFDLDGRMDLAAHGAWVSLNQSGPRAFNFAADGVTLVWPSVIGALTYDVYRGDSSVLVDGNGDGLPDDGYGTCITGLDDDPRDTFFVDGEEPSAGSGFFYLMSAVDAGGSGGLGSTSAGLPRVPEIPCP